MPLNSDVFSHREIPKLSQESTGLIEYKDLGSWLPDLEDLLEKKLTKDVSQKYLMSQLVIINLLLSQRIDLSVRALLLEVKTYLESLIKKKDKVLELHEEFRQSIASKIETDGISAAVVEIFKMLDGDFYTDTDFSKLSLQDLQMLRVRMELSLEHISDLDQEHDPSPETVRVLFLDILPKLKIAFEQREIELEQ